MHLRKTELACRLHYHQITRGSHRRRRTASVSSDTPHGSLKLLLDHSQHSVDDKANVAMGESPERDSPNSYASTGSAPRCSNTGVSPRRIRHTVPSSELTSIPLQETPKSNGWLRINTASDPANRSSAVDIDRLRAIYEAHCAPFWASIAVEYGSNMCSVQLEDIWRQNISTVQPPTPSEGGSCLSQPALESSPPSSCHPTSAVERVKGFSPIC